MAATTTPPADVPQAPGAADVKAKNDAATEARKNDEPQFFEGTFAKLVERENADGDTEVVEVMSDNLYPGEKRKRDDDQEKADEKAKVRKAAFEKDAKNSK